jgi:hypothetical protein
VNPIDGSPIGLGLALHMLRQKERNDAVRSELESLRARYSLLEERVASAERRLAKLRNL